jgi:hypothetical protein
MNGYKDPWPKPVLDKIRALIAFSVRVMLWGDTDLLAVLAKIGMAFENVVPEHLHFQRFKTR